MGNNDLCTQNKANNMKKTIIFLLASVAIMACSNSIKQQTEEKETLSLCDIVIGDVHFTSQKNNAAQGITIVGDTMKFVAGAQTDYFRSPDGSVINSSPVVFTEIDNTKPFTFTAKVEPQFTKDGTYSAGVLYVYESDTHSQKMCFEQDEYGDHRVVTVRTIETSDDNNHQSISGKSVYMRISSDGKQIGSYYSEDGTTWRMARLYKNDYPSKILLGLSSQSPKANFHTSFFTEVSIANKAVTDFRCGSLE